MFDAGPARGRQGVQPGAPDRQHREVGEMPRSDAVDEFAELLRTMKNRSGRSYDALARRVNMSSSALHRYCSGDTVPTEFETVARLGTICRASPEGLLELHRRWA